MFGYVGEIYILSSPTRVVYKSAKNVFYGFRNQKGRDFFTSLLREHSKNLTRIQELSHVIPEHRRQH